MMRTPKAGQTFGVFHMQNLLNDLMIRDSINPNRSLDTPCPFLIGKNEAFGHLARFCPHPVARYAST